LRIAVDRGIAFDPRPPEIDAPLPWLALSVDQLAARLPEPEQRYWLAAALAALSHQVQLSTLPDPRLAAPDRSPTATELVASSAVSGRHRHAGSACGQRRWI
jgi:hypothetical protein